MYTSYLGGGIFLSCFPVTEISIKRHSGAWISMKLWAGLNLRMVNTQLHLGIICFWICGTKMPVLLRFTDTLNFWHLLVWLTYDMNTVVVRSFLYVGQRLKVKGKGKKYSSSQTASPLRELTCHMGSHNVTCHPAEVTFPPLPQPIKAVKWFSWLPNAFSAMPKVMQQHGGK